LNSKAINKVFYDSAKSFVVAAMSLVLSYLEQGERIPTTPIERHVVDGDSSCRIDYVEQPDTWHFVYAHETQIRAIHEYDACVKIMQADAVISKHLDCLIGSSYSRFRMTAWDYLRNLLSRQLFKSQEKLRFDNEIFEKAYFDLEHFFYNETIPTIAFSPLHNFNSEVDSLELEEGLCIRKLKVKEREGLLDESRFSEFSLPEVLSLKYVIELTYETKKMFGEMEIGRLPEANPQEKINKLVIALRLFKPGVTGISIVRMRYDLDIPIMGTITQGSLSRGLYFGKEYNLTNAELEDFKRFWNELGSADYQGIAIRRFNYAYLRGDPEDKLIDVMIALEALFLKGEKGGASSGTTIAVACSILIGKNQLDREKIKKTLTRAYTIRNCIVHGSEYERIRTDAKTSAKFDTLPELVSEVEDYLRESIKKLLD